MVPDDSFLGQCLLCFGVVYQYDSWGGSLCTSETTSSVTPPRHYQAASAISARLWEGNFYLAFGWVLGLVFFSVLLLEWLQYCWR